MLEEVPGLSQMKARWKLEWWSEHHLPQKVQVQEKMMYTSAPNQVALSVEEIAGYRGNEVEEMLTT